MALYSFRRSSFLIENRLSWSGTTLARAYQGPLVKSDLTADILRYASGSPNKTSFGPTRTSGPKFNGKPPRRDQDTILIVLPYLSPRSFNMKLNFPPLVICCIGRIERELRKGPGMCRNRYHDDRYQIHSKIKAKSVMLLYNEGRKNASLVPRSLGI